MAELQATGGVVGRGTDEEGRVVGLEVSGIDGQIPAEPGNLVNLEWLHKNRLSGEIPAEPDNLVNVKWLYLDGSQSSGYVPSGELLGSSLSQC